MACREHICVECDYAVFNNLGGPSICPKCGGNMNHYWDEVPDREPPERERFCDDDEADED